MVSAVWETTNDQVHAFRIGYVLAADFCNTGSGAGNGPRAARMPSIDRSERERNATGADCRCAPTRVRNHHRPVVRSGGAPAAASGRRNLTEAVIFDRS